MMIDILVQCTQCPIRCPEEYLTTTGLCHTCAAETAEGNLDTADESTKERRLLA